MSTSWRSKWTAANADRGALPNRQIAEIANGAEKAESDTASPGEFGNSGKSGNSSIWQRGSLYTEALEERAALVEFGAGVPRPWAEGFARLDLAFPPVGFSSARWRLLIDDAGRFLDRWAPEAARLGWRAEDVFGVHPEVPAARYDAMGLAPLIGGGDVTAISAERATITSLRGNVLVYVRRKHADAVPVWDIAEGAQSRARR